MDSYPFSFLDFLRELYAFYHRMGNSLDACAGAPRSLVPCGDTAGTRKKSFGSMAHFDAGLGPREHRPRGEFVLCLDRYEVPRDVCPSGACFVDLSIFTSAGVAGGRPVTGCYTVGRGFVAFPVAPRDDDVLVATLYDCDGTSGRSIGSAEIPVRTLRKHLLGDPGRFALQDEEGAAGAVEKEEREGAVSNGDPYAATGHVFVSLMGTDQGPRVGDDGNPLQRRAKEQDAVFPQFEKEFFLIRHGQSVWNEGKSANNPIKMMMQSDHPLTSQGILQANMLNLRWREIHGSDGPLSSSASLQKKDLDGDTAAEKNVPKSDPELERKFRQASRIIASPMTRALQTALVACHEHSALKETSLLLDRNLRERKNTGFSVDCTGVAVGPGEIDSRTRTTLLDHCGLSEGDEGAGQGDVATTFSATDRIFTLQEINSRLKPKIDVNNCDTRWWTRDSDNKTDIGNRFSRLWSGLKYMEEPSAILVGHSNLFFDLISRYLDARFCQTNRTWAEQLKCHKMDNAAVMYVKVQFPEGSIGGTALASPRILDAQMLFGTKLSESAHAASDQQGVHSGDRDIGLAEYTEEQVEVPAKQITSVEL